MVSWDMLTARRSASTNDIIHDMSVTIHGLIQEANLDKYLPAKSYMLFDETRQVTNEDDCTVVPMTLQMS